MQNRQKSLITCLNLRLVVGYLGEKSQFGWWQTTFFDPSSRLFLEPVFTKTTKLAQYYGIREAARRLHDDHIGIGKVFHLFRLPEEMEYDLHQLMLTSPSVIELYDRLRSKDDALQLLAQLASDKPENPGAGPVAIAKLKETLLPQTQKVMARMYLTAFTQGTKAYPYLEC